MPDGNDRLRFALGSVDMLDAGGADGRQEFIYPRFEGFDVLV